MDVSQTNEPATSATHTATSPEKDDGDHATALPSTEPPPAGTTSGERAHSPSTSTDSSTCHNLMSQENRMGDSGLQVSEVSQDAHSLTGRQAEPATQLYPATGQIEEPAVHRLYHVVQPAADAAQAAEEHVVAVHHPYHQPQQQMDPYNLHQGYQAAAAAMDGDRPLVVTHRPNHPGGARSKRSQQRLPPAAMVNAAEFQRDGQSDSMSGSSSSDCEDARLLALDGVRRAGRSTPPRGLRHNGVDRNRSRSVASVSPHRLQTPRQRRKQRRFHTEHRSLNAGASALWPVMPSGRHVDNGMPGYLGSGRPCPACGGGGGLGGSRCPGPDGGCFPPINHHGYHINGGVRRAGSGSFGGADESEEEIAFVGLDQNSVNASFQSMDSMAEEMLKRKLKFHFMNPRDKYMATRQLPWKLVLQIIKVVLVTAQLVVFARFRYAHVNYYTDQTISFDHFFIKDWDMAREVHAYPPATGTLALYRKKEFYNVLDYAIKAYINIEDLALGPFFKNSSVEFCVDEYREANITKDLSFKLNMTMKTTCIYLQEEEFPNFNNSREWFEQNQLKLSWFGITNVALRFNLTSVALKSLGPRQTPDCFKFKVVIRFDNEDHDGQIPITLDMLPIRQECNSDYEHGSSYQAKLTIVLNVIVGVVCSCSLILCMRALMRAQLLKHETVIFFKRRLSQTLTLGERLEFLNLWYVMICVNDCMIILGTILKQLIESKSVIGDMWDICSLLIGTGCLLVWFGLLRYLGFFKTYNVLILTMKKAAPDMLRFLCCAGLLYIGFVFAGYLILGPYHFKFSNIMSTSECLFSLINGDDMFATFNSLSSEKAHAVWMYSRVYLYSFICLFIYVVLSLFISIIMDMYEVIKTWYDVGFPPTRIEKFYRTTDFDFSTGQYKRESMFPRIWNLVRNHWWNRNRSAYERI